MMDDKMDVDSEMDMHASTNFEHISPSSSSSSGILDDDKDKLNNHMKAICKRCYWRNLMDDAQASNASKDFERVFSIILSELLGNIEDAKMKNNLIEISEVCDFVRRLDSDGLGKWKATLQDCMDMNDWTALILHPKLRKPKVINVALGVPIENKNAVINAWKFKYHGSAHKVLLRAIDELHNLDQTKNYAKNLPIVQSSATGKSKTVDKVATERILFPMCLREDIGDDYFAYPHTDEEVRVYFEHAPSTAKENECKKYIRSFLSAFFTSALKLAMKLFPEEKEKENIKQVSYEKMAMTFYDFFADQELRDDFYTEVVVKAKAGSFIDFRSCFKGLVEYLKLHCSRWLSPAECPFLIAIDEVHVLYTRRLDKGLKHTLYSLLRSVLSEAVEYPFVVVSLSTARSVSESSLPPSREIAPSMRERNYERQLPATFTELPFDVHIAADPLVPGKATLYSVGSLEFTTKFGRPLFHAYFLSLKDEGRHTVDGIMSNVQMKLSGRPWPPKVLAPASLDASSIAVLSARLLLDLSPASTDAKGYEAELVRNHLRLLYSVQDDRRTIVTGSPPEPLVAEASARIMHYHLDQESYMDYWDLLREFVDRGLAAQGSIGELIGRALSICAMDCAIDKLEDSELSELKYQTPVRVTDYYKALLTEDAWDILRQSVPANRARMSDDSATRTFEDAFKDAYFHFSHYGKANHDSSPMYAWALWLRGTAAVACQELGDRMAPIYFSKLGNVSPKTISVHLDQDKTGQNVNPNTVAIQSAESLPTFFSDGNNLPCIVAVHCYALTTTTKKQGILVTMPSPSSSYPPHRDSKIDAPEAPRYQINFCGLSAYGNITEGVKVLIRRMIDQSKNTAVFSYHPREYGVPLLRRMLPVLTNDLESMEWFGADTGMV